MGLAVWYAIRAIGLDDGPDSEMGNDERWMRGLPENTGDDMALISGGGGMETRNYF
jgi:hypothetical protein